MHAAPDSRAYALYSSTRPLPGKGSRVVLRLYSVAAGALGAIVILWGPTWLTSLHLAGQPFGRAALVRVFGAIVVAASFCAAGLAAVDDPHARHKGLVWFAAAHLVVFVVALSQRLVIWGPGPFDYAFWLLLAVTLVLLMAEYEYPVAALLNALGRSVPRPAERLRSAHDRQIREAAGQEERNRLARELHDSIKQQIFAIQTAAATAQTRFDTDAGGARQAIDLVRASARDAMTEMEVMLDQLRVSPLANAGLVESLKKQCEALGFRTGADVKFTLGTLPPDEALPAGTQQAMLRVAQEALANVARHARAATVTVSLESVKGRLQLDVRDDGAGFDAGHRRGMGMENMSARAIDVGGAIEMSTRPGEGTLVRFSVPYLAEARVRHLKFAVLWGVLLAGSLINLRHGLDRAPLVAAVVVATVAVLGLAWSGVVHWRLRRAGRTT
jgi:signal transduction histidine kinase